MLRQDKQKTDNECFARLTHITVYYMISGNYQKKKWIRHIPLPIPWQ